MSVRLIPVALVLLALAGACAEASPDVAPFDPTTIEAQIPSVASALREGDPLGALAALDARAADGTLPAGAEHYRAIALADAGRLDDAVAAFERELLAHPGNGHAHALLADVLIELGRLDAVPAHLDAARRFAPNLASLPLISGRAALLLGDDIAAQRHFRDALIADPYGTSAAEAHHALAQISARRGEEGREQARLHSVQSAYLEEVHAFMSGYAARLRDDPLDVEAAFGMAAARVSMALRFGGDGDLLALAEAALGNVLALAPDHARATFNLGFVRTMQGRDEEACTLYQRATQLDPDYGAAHKNLAQCLRLRGDLDASVAAYHRAIASLPDAEERLQCHLALVEVLDTQGDLGGAVVQMRTAIELMEDPAPAFVERLAQLEVRLAALKSDADASREDG